MSPIVLLKRCKKCGQEFPATVEYFHRGRGQFGVRQPCKECRSKEDRTRDKQRQKLRYANDSEHRERLLAQMRRPEARQRKNRQRNEKYASDPIYRKKINQQNTEKHRHRMLTDTEYVVHKREANNRNRNRLSDYASKRRRRARQKQLPYDWTVQDERYALNYWNNYCAVCGRPRGLWHTMALDHWIPVTKGGATIPENLIPLCHGVDGCNVSKNNRDPIEWLEYKLGKRKARQKLKEIEAFFASVRKV